MRRLFLHCRDLRFKASYSNFPGFRNAVGAEEIEETLNMISSEGDEPENPALVIQEPYLPPEDKQPTDVAEDPWRTKLLTEETGWS